MLEKIDQVIDLVAKSRHDKSTRALTVSAVIAFGIAVGAIAVYDHVARKLNLSHDQRRIDQIDPYEEEEYY